MQRKVEELQQLKGEMTEQLKVERRYFFPEPGGGPDGAQALARGGGRPQAQAGGERGRFDGIAVKEIDLGFL